MPARKPPKRLNQIPPTLDRIDCHPESLAL